MAKSNRKYWAKRFEDLKRAELQTSKSYVADLNEAFDKASAEVEKDLAQWFQRLADNNGVSLAKAKQMLDAKALKEFHWDVEEYQKRMMEDGKNHIWMKELENASAKTHISWLEAEKLRLQQSVEELYAKHAADTKSFLGRTYQDGYLHSAYEVQHGIGEGSPFRVPYTRTIDKVLSKPWAPDGKNFSDRIWKEKDKLVGELHTNLTQMVTRGEAPDRAIKAIADRFNVSRSKAGRLVSTEAAFFASASQRDCFNGLGVEEYEILATLDTDTCSECASLDGEVHKQSEFEPGVTAPPFHPNCHCSTIPHFDDEFTTGERRAARDKDGNYYTVPKDMKYPEWKAKYGEGAVEELPKGGKGDTIETGAKGALNDKNDPNGTRREDHANTFYESIRNSDKESFVNNVSASSGLPQRSISKVFDHVFVDAHLLSGGNKRFDPDYDMAESFRRLRAGDDIQEHDIVLLKHERLEYELMKKYKKTYQQAHRLAASKHNYVKALSKYKKKRGL